MSAAVRIPLHGHTGEGLFALVDASIASKIRAYRWIGARKRTGVYAVTYVKEGRRFKQIYLHQLVLPNAPEHTDHRNGDTLDCRKKNLRLATTQQNIWNSPKWRRETTSIYKGVFLTSGRGGRPLSKPWRARIHLNRSAVHLGRFATQEEAARAYDSAARKLYGEFACTDFPRKGERSAIEGKRGSK